jgi:hypothetical protein
MVTVHGMLLIEIGEGDGDGDGDGLGLGEGDGDGLGLGEGDGDADGDADGLGDGLGDGLAIGEGEGIGCGAGAVPCDQIAMLRAIHDDQYASLAAKVTLVVPAGIAMKIRSTWPSVSVPLGLPSPACCRVTCKSWPVLVVTVMLPLFESSSKRRKLFAGAAAEKWAVVG